MPIPHKHAAVIKAWADGETVQYFNNGTWGDYPAKPAKNWCYCGDPTFEWRIKPVPHKWQKEMDAFAAGKDIEFRSKDLWANEWKPCRLPIWSDDWEYRIKPERVEKSACITLMGDHLNSDLFGKDNVIFIFEDGKLKGVKLL